ncbi:unnamed protein product [Arabidopsis arenosa]|uniref:F-box domain-containing protein n=1 Tax=Arabidopsis arenosa TaxID=38785 RepID=A0A8S2ALA8_ARAAE|nr:unnamed protein product [Arabidopsis arenosa]
MCFPRATSPGLVDAIAKLPLLETLEVSHSCLILDIQGIGQACPRLKTFKLKSSGRFWSARIKCDDDYYALEIAENMPELRHLYLDGNKLSDIGLNAILDGCPHLEHLDLHNRFHLFLLALATVFLSLPPAMEDGDYRNWAELPAELTSSVLLRLGVVEILENAQKVCRSWRRVCKDPSMWRKIVIDNSGNRDIFKYDLESMCRHAVDRSQGGLLEIDIEYFGTDKLLDYIADSSSNLRSLRLVRCHQITDKGVAEAVVKLPLLEDLEVSYCSFSGECLSVVGQSCPHLKTLKLNRRPHYSFDLLSHACTRRPSLIKAIVHNTSSNLKSFALPVCYPSITTIEELVNAIAKFPFLETLEFFDFLFILDLKAIGHACPQLKTLKINFSGYTPCDDDDAIAIAESMPELRHLQLIGNGRLTDTGLNAIRDGCPHLEHLDRRDESPGDHDRHEIVIRASDCDPYEIIIGCS